ncbi:DUF5642 family protein [Williamsia deligens]|uniref:DUF5642 family protein n=1 Tax=Williamsia deligens TaxID=321325 RepID=A0ABW3GBM3_9NOCA|nr:DUF5642 family protein [Williamsia deligens]MCP2195415.1 hypothetical protein [Williamsia deligens]
MTAPRRLRAVLVAIVVACAVGGCTQSVDGEPVAASGSSAAGDIDRLTISPREFPAGYPATRLPSAQAGEVLEDLSGRPNGGSVTPSDCLPPALVQDSARTVVVTGQSTSGGNLTVVVTRAQSPLADLADAVARCGSYSMDVGAVRSTVTAQVLPPSPIDSQESLAFRRTSTSGRAPVTIAQTTTVLAAQNDGVRVYAAYVAFSGAPLDGAALDAVFTTAVARSRGR